ncbi:MAG: alpha/beta hydrolase family protein, partial [Alphaproteobacteria bacterium]
KHFSIVSFIDGVRYVVIVEVGGKPLTVIPPYKGMSINWANWANNEIILIRMSGEKEIHSAFGKINANRLISYNINGGKPRNMQKEAKIKGTDNNTYMADWSAIVDWMHEEPDYILLAMDEDGADASVEVRKVNVNTGNYTLEVDFYGPLQNWMTDQQNELRLATGIDRKNRSADGDVSVIYYRNPETNNMNKVEKDINSDFVVLGFFEDPRFAYVRDTNEAGFLALYKFDMIKWERIETIREMQDDNVGGLVHDRFSDLPVGYTYMEGGESKILYFDKGLARIQRMMNKALPGHDISITSYDKAKNLFVIYAGSDIEPGAYYLFNNGNKQLAFMEGAYEGLDPRLMSPMQDVSYEARDGLTIPAYLTVPIGSDGKNLPTVILPHGGPEARDYWGYDFIVQFLASRGYAVLQPQFRGSDGFSEEFADLGRKEWGLKMQDDVTDGALWMIEQGITDPDRMCIMGWSYGGYVAMTATFNTPELYKCSVSINGVSDLPRIIYDTSNFTGSSYWLRHIGDPGKDKEKLRRTSANYNIDKIRMPILVIANKDDPVVDYKQSTSFVKKMKAAGKFVKYYEIKEGGHGALEGEGRLIILKEAEKFLARYIGKGN